MDIMKMTKEDFYAVPIFNGNRNDLPLFDSIVIVPTNKLHDNGYMYMYFIGCKNDEPVIRLSGYSDTICLDGVGGYGKWEDKVPSFTIPKGWSIDCLPCGYIRLSCRDSIEIGKGFRSFEIYATDKKG